MSYKHAIQTLQWSTHIEVDEPDGVTYYDGTDYKPSEDLKEKVKKAWESFEAQALEIGFDPEIHRVASYDPNEGTLWDYVAHDFILTVNRHGSGFWDTGRYSEPMATKLTEICRKFPEMEVYLSDANLLEVY